jgi:predicted transcriptional regulator
MSLLDKAWFGGEVEKFFGSKSFVRARIIDPLTSHMAAESVADVAPAHMDVIYACLKRFGPLGKDGISEKTGLTNSQVARRLPELQKLGMVALTGKTVRSSSGRQEREWIIL